MKQYLITIYYHEPLVGSDSCYQRRIKKVEEYADCDNHAKAIAAAWIALFQVQRPKHPGDYQADIVRYEWV